MYDIGQGPTALAVGAGGGGLDIFSLLYHFSHALKNISTPAKWKTGFAQQHAQLISAEIGENTQKLSVLVVFVVFCVHMYSFAGLIRRTPPPTFSDTAITDRHSDTTIFQLRAHWVRISWSIGSEKSFGHVPPVAIEPSTSCVQGEHPIH